jgi:hypothetical protein
MFPPSDSEDCRPLGSNRVQDGSNVFDPLLQRG